MNTRFSKLSDGVLSFLKKEVQEQDIIFYLSGPSVWREKIDIVGLTAIFNHHPVYNNYFSTDKTIIIDYNHYRFKKIENLKPNLENCQEFWYIDLINNWYLSHLMKEDILLHIKRKVKNNLINIDKLKEMFDLYGNKDLPIYSELRVLGIL